jgi:DinB superfamily
MLNELSMLYARDLQALTRELEAYPSEASLWQPAPGILNPGGTLALHLAGNLSEFVGRRLGGRPYTRDREAEFGRRDVPRAELLKLVQQAADAVHTTLQGLDPATLTQPYPTPLPGFPPDMTVTYMLIHLHSHISWHLGQMNYHRRMLHPEPAESSA